ncbi:MAG: hypothetical protein ACU0GG_15295 [Paracoccaceae bacterium]
MSKFTPILLAAAFTALAACDEINGERDAALIGAAIGCAAGFTLVNGRCVEGAVAGGVAGAVSQR